MEAKYQKFNNILGWAVFGIASFVYLSTIEPTASFWDCGEYIACSYKLEVGHPPGAPLFALLGRLFSLFAFGDTSKVAMMINIMSALCSAGTVLFLFWTITYFTKKIILSNGTEFTEGKMYAVLGSGLVGALSYTFSDSFWFSAVEGEVYAMSSFFTAAIFWAVLKWERAAGHPYADRWIVLIFFLLGLAIGVHLLGILVIPAFVFVYYFKKYKVTRKGFILTGILSLIILGLVQSVIIPGVVSLSAKFELFFVNTIGMPFNSGTIFYFILLIGVIVWGLYYTAKKKKVLWNTIILCFTALLIGYSPFFILIIRSQSNPPIDENNPENAISLLSYLKREQYGDWPILHGQYYNAPLFYGKDVDPESDPLYDVDENDPTPHYADGDPVYVRDEKAGKYVVADDRKDTKPNYDKRFCTFFPRMWSQQSNHERAYKAWGDIKGAPVKVRNPGTGEYETIMKPTFGENLAYFWNYQVVHMYLRYFMWNFSGRQNDVQGHGIEYSSRIEGNWLSGIPFIDELRLGTQDKLPESVTGNKANNKFYCLPLLLGLFGLFFHYKKNKADWWVVMLMFLLTGIAIVVYLNQYPYQPRERDYAYAGSTYAFAVWIGMGVAAIWDFLGKKFSNGPQSETALVKRSEKIRAALTTLICLLAVPFIMGKEGWDDHSRANRYTCRDFAAAYLNSCPPNAILFTNGDNDTFPLWYAQEVEGIRTDVRVVNLSLANTDWYIEQLRKKMYESPPVPLMLTQDKYANGNRDFVPIRQREELKDQVVDLKEMISFVGSDDPRAKISWGRVPINYLPTQKFRLAVDSADFVNTLPKNFIHKEKIQPYIEWDMGKRGYIMKSDLLILDILAASNWKRPICFAVTVGPEAFIGLERYFQIEGLAYHLVPYQPRPGQPRLETDVMYDNLMNKVQWGGLDKNEVWMDENNLRMALTMRMQMRTLALSLVQEGKKDSAMKVLKKVMEMLPEKNVPYCYEPLTYTHYLIQAFYMADGKEDAIKLSRRFFDILEHDTEYALLVRKKEPSALGPYLEQRLEFMQQLLADAMRFKAEPLTKELENRFSKYKGLVASSDQLQIPQQPQAEE